MIKDISPLDISDTQRSACWATGNTSGNLVDAPGGTWQPFPGGTVGCELPYSEGRKRLWEAVLVMPWPLFTKKRTQCLWQRCSWSLSWGSKAISTRAHPGVSSSSGHCSCSCHHDKLSLYGKFVFGSLYTSQVPVSFLLREKHEASPGSSLMMVARSQLNWYKTFPTVNMCRNTCWSPAVLCMCYKFCMYTVSYNFYYNQETSCNCTCYETHYL